MPARPAKRARDHAAEECPMCGAHRGLYCRNYKGRRKQPCRIAVRPPPGRPPPPKPVQRSLFDFEKEES